MISVCKNASCYHSVCEIKKLQINLINLNLNLNPPFNATTRSLLKLSMASEMLIMLFLSMMTLATQAYHIVDPVFTPYYQNGSVNYEVIPAYLDLCIKSDVDIVLLGGSTAEWPSLTSEERLLLLSAWRNAVDDLPSNTTKPKILFHAGDTSIAKAQYLTSESKKNGADWILLVAPCIMRPATLDDLITTLQTIASKAPDLPMIYYHYPALYGVDFDMSGTSLV